MDLGIAEDQRQRRLHVFAVMDSNLDELLWIEELLPHDILMEPKYGGQAYYLDSNLVLILVEHAERTNVHKGREYPFDLWRGCIIPVEKRKQNAFFLKYLFLENHPVNKDWLYIPLESENFEEEVKQLLLEISRRNVLLGLPVKFSGMPKAAKNAPKKKTAKKPKVDKKKENAFLLNMMNKKK